MTSTQEQIDESYSISNEFFALWLDKNMHYTSALFQGQEELTLEQAQENKCRRLYDLAELGPDKTVLDIGCGWGSFLDYCHRRGIASADGITLSTEQASWCMEHWTRWDENIRVLIQDYHTYEPHDLYDGLVSIEMIDHLCSPEQQRQGLAVPLFTRYFTRLADWVAEGSCFALQNILRDRIPRTRKDLLDLQHTADVIFPGGLNPRVEEVLLAIKASKKWEICEMHMMRDDYRRTTSAWLAGLQAHEAEIRQRWGDQLYIDYERYLSTCVRAFDRKNQWSGDQQWKLRRVDFGR